MSAAQPMSSARRRPIPGMASQPVAAQPVTPAQVDQPVAGAQVAGTSVTAPLIPDEPDGRLEARSSRGLRGDRRSAAGGPPERRRAADYASTRLVNFRIPVDLHDRFRGLVREVEARHPRLRRPSLTELVIALLEEGPQSGDEVAELIRRKRAAEHEER